jgi:hypothetical protein
LVGAWQLHEPKWKKFAKLLDFMAIGPYLKWRTPCNDFSSFQEFEFNSAQWRELPCP